MLKLFLFFLSIIIFSNCVAQTESYTISLDKGYENFKQDNFISAIPFFEKAYSEINPEKNKEDFRILCLFLSQCFTNTNEISKAENFLTIGIQSYNCTMCVEDLIMAKLLNLLGLLNMTENQLIKAETALLKSQSIVKNLSGTISEEYVTSINNLARLYDLKVDYAKSEAYYVEAIKISRKIEGFDPSMYATLLSSLGLLYSNSNTLKEDTAIIIYKEAIAENKKTFGVEHPDYAMSLSFLSELYVDQGKFDLAKPLTIEAISIIKKNSITESLLNARVYNQLAEIYNKEGDFENSEKFYLETLAITKNQHGEDNKHYATILSNLAVFYQTNGRTEKAESFFFQTLKIYNKLADTLNSALTMSLLAAFYEDEGNLVKAENFFLQPINFLKDRPSFYVTALNNMGNFYLGIRKLNEAEFYLTSTVEILTKLYGRADGRTLVALSNMASLYGYQGNRIKQELVLKEVVKNEKKVLGNTHPAYLSSLNNLAVLYLQEHNYLSAGNLFKEILSTREILGELHPDYIFSLKNLAGFYHYIDSLSVSLLYWEKYISALKKEIISHTFYQSENELIKYLNRLGIVEALNSLSSLNFKTRGIYPKSSELLLENEYLLKGLSLRNTANAIKVVEHSSDTVLINQLHEYRLLKNSLSNIHSLPKAKHPTYLPQLEENANTLEKKLVKGSQIIKIGNEIGKTSWKQVQQSLKPNEATVEIVCFNYINKKWTDSTMYCALVLRKGYQFPFMVPLFEKKQLDSILQQTGNKNANDNVKTLYASRGIGVLHKAVLSVSLYDLIWKPLENELKGINTIYFAPAGELHRIAFAALPVNDKEVLSDKYKLVQLASTASVIDQQPFYVSASDKINLYGGISYNVDTTALKTAAISYHVENKSASSLPADIARGGSWSALPGTATEVQGIVAARNNKNNLSLLSGINATEESIKALEGNNSPVVLHIATHGFFFPNPKREGKNNIELGFEGGKAFKRSDDPLFRSGLLFAGANNAWSGKAAIGIEDGILTSYEVSNMYLPNTKLVVLSACETGLGDIKGSEGVYGLQRAFKMAGAENLIMSLWKVPDASTAEFMQELYKNLFAKQSIAEAFNNAQTTMKNKYRNDPYKWAAWVMVN